jgi:flagellin
MKINTNVLAVMTHKNLLKTQNSMEKAVQRLSSGLRINSGADDAAGLAISEKMRAQIASLDQAIKNANYAVNMLQTADGAMSVIDEKLIRMRQLAGEAANDTLSTEDRAYADEEFQQLKNEIERIANVTEYNGKKLIDGTYSSSPLTFQVGTYNTSNDRISVTIDNMTASGLGIDALTISTLASAQAAISTIDCYQHHRCSHQIQGQCQG